MRRTLQVRRESSVLLVGLLLLRVLLGIANGSWRRLLVLLGLVVDLGGLGGLGLRWNALGAGIVLGSDELDLGDVLSVK